MLNKVIIFITYIIIILVTFILTQNKNKQLLSLLVINILLFISNIFFNNKLMLIIDILIKTITLYLSFKYISKEMFLDELTKAYNRKILKKLKYQIKLNKTALLLYDVDKFKSINDTYGHNYGDKVLLDIAKILKEVTTNKNYVIRFGGDEFIIIFKFKNIKEIKQLINNINKKINIYNNKEKVKISLSLGYEIIKSKTDFKHFIEQVDKKLYTNKKNC